MRRTIHAAGPRPAGDVWDRYLRPRRWAEWSPQIRSVEYPGETLKPGVAGVVRGPGGLPVRFRILDVEPRLAWSWEVSAAMVRLRLWHSVEAIGHGSRTLLTIEGPVVPVLLYLPLAKLAIRRLVR